MTKLFGLNLVLILAAMSSATSFAELSISCGTDLDPDNYKMKNEVFGIGGDDACQGPATKKAYWGISINGKSVFGNDITAEVIKDGSCVGSIKVTVPAKGYRPAAVYEVADPYGDAPELIISPSGDKFQCISSND